MSFAIDADLGAGGNAYIWGGSSDAQVGAYGEWNRRALRPGIEVRYQSLGGGAGTVAGPRLSMTLGHFHPYVAGLFGVSHAQVDATDAKGNTVQQEQRGVLSEAAVGVEWDRFRWLRWKIVEVTGGHSTSAPNSNPGNVYTGLVVRFP